MAGVTIRLNRAGIARVTHTRLVRAGNQVLNESARRVNVDTGNLRGSRAMEDRGTFLRIVYRAHYARYVHDGTRYYRGNPYLVNAARAVMSRLAR